MNDLKGRTRNVVKKSTGIKKSSTGLKMNKVGESKSAIKIVKDIKKGI